MKPMMPKITKPAKKLVRQLPMDTTRESLDVNNKRAMSVKGWHSAEPALMERVMMSSVGFFFLSPKNILLYMARIFYFISITL